MAVEVASAYVSLLPSFKGGTRRIQNELSRATGTAAQRAGRDAGQRFGASFAQGTGRIGNNLIGATGGAAQRAGRESGQRFGTAFNGGTKRIGDQLAGTTRTASQAAGRESGNRFGSVFATAALPPFRAFGTAALGFFAVDKLKTFFTSAIVGASDLSEAGNKIRVVFGDAAGQIERFAASGAKNLGQSKLSVLNAAATFGVYGKAAGLATTENTKFSTELVKLSADLASFYNTTPEEAIEAIGAALRGESEPIRAYGVLLDDVTLRNEALKLGLIKTTKQALTPQQKVLAAHAAIMKQTKVAQGDFAKTSGGLANQQRILSAQWENLKAKLGKALLPALTKLATLATTRLLPALTRLGRTLSATLGPAIARVAAWFRSLSSGAQSGTAPLTGMLTRFRELATALSRQLAPAVGPVLNGLRRIAVEVAPLLQSAGQLLIALFTRLAQAGTWLAQRLGPYAVPVITSAWRIISTLVSTVLRHLTGAFRVMTALLKGDWSAAWRHARTLVASTAGGILSVVRLFFTRYIPAAVRFGIGTVQQLWGAGWRWILRTVQGLGSRIWAWAQLAMTRLALAVGGGIQAAVGFFLALPIRVVGALAGLGRSLYRAGANALQSLWDGAKAIARKFLAWFRGLADKIRGLWPFSPAKWGPLRSHPMDRAGRNLMLGLATGIRQSTGTVVGHAQRAAALVGNAAGTPTSYAQRARSLPPAVRGRAASGPGTPLTINVAGVTDPDALAREVMRRAAWAASLA